MQEIEKDRVFYEESGGGVTFSGGEPFSQPGFLLQLLKQCKQQAIHTCLDTTGYVDEWILDQIADWVDLFLFDLKFIDDAQHQKYTGVSNIVILDNLRNLSKKGKKILIRIPIIPRINDAPEEITRMCDFIASLDTIQGIDLLPFHKIGKNKYTRLHLHYKMEKFFEPSIEDLLDLKKKFEVLGFPVKIGG
jgi:pyruvate formate lyase activating enzyme